MAAPLTILCLASYYKGIDLLRELRRQDCTVLLVTSKSLEDGEWPRDSIDAMWKGASCERSSAGTVRRRLPSRMAEARSRRGWSSAARPTIGRCSLSAR